jgi:hypothetical protein
MDSCGQHSYALQRTSRQHIKIMIYTFAVARSPLKVIPDVASSRRHYFGGSADGLDIGAGSRIVRVLTLDLGDPMLSFLRFDGRRELPLVMDFATGAVDYSVRGDGTLVLHSAVDTEATSLLESELPQHSARLEPFSYEQYRAAVFASAGPDESFLSAEDAAALRSLGESYTQVGGTHPRASAYRPYCANPECAGYGGQVTQLLATISQTPAPGVSLEFLPYDPAIEFAFCHSCHSVSGVIVPD